MFETDFSDKPIQEQKIIKAYLKKINYAKKYFFSFFFSFFFVLVHFQKVTGSFIKKKIIPFPMVI